MTFRAVSSASFYAANQQSQSGLSTLCSAIESGDLTKAKRAYAALGLPNMSSTNKTPLARLYRALSNDDLAAAKQAAQELQGKRSTQTASTGTGTNTSTTTDTKTNTSATTNAATKAAEAANTYSSAKSRYYSIMSALGVGNSINTWG